VLTFEINDATATASVEVQGDTVGEQSEGFMVFLAQAVDATIDADNDSVRFTIANDDAVSVITGTEFDDVITETEIDPADILGTPSNLDDIIESLAGDDTVDGGDGNDTIDGGEGNDTLFGGAGDDLLLGGGGNDPDLSGDAGNDTIDGGIGGDKLWGGEGTDTLIGGEGVDTMDGGAGADTFVFIGSSGDDKIDNFIVGEDKIDFSDYPGVSFDGLKIEQGSGGLNDPPITSTLISGLLTSRNFNCNLLRREDQCHPGAGEDV
jgi:Ca2+-binding RTX toxin-like protein